ncbi:MAG: carbohydrate-binding domain-containing protein, partial [Calditrichaeota bacterium]|nr:carbohydrate-binding domain-containing protein [Calditrichota bacterium]
MTKTLLFTLWVVFLSTQAFTQEVNIIKNDGGNVLFNLSEIDSITFSLQDTLAPPVNARDKLQIHTQSGTFQLPVSEIDSVYFNPEGTVAFFQTTASLNQIALAEIDSITFGSNLDSTVYISYDETTVSVTNPLAFLGVSVEASGADVTVTSTAAISDITYVLSGVTADGMFKIYSEKRLQLRLEGIQITNPDGPAINIQSSKKITVQLADGSDNIFSDGTTYAPPPNNEDQSAAFFSEGQLIFEGSGSLAINGVGENEHG